jgi:uncharacterized repeat protein (TIGR01451 family)
MGFGASAQTIQSIKVDPGNNDAPPAGPILDFGGTYAAPQTPPVAEPSGGNLIYQQYTANFTATTANTTCTNGVCSTVIAFAFRDDPAQISFTNASVVDLTADNGINLLTNGNFATGDLTGWSYTNTYGVSGAGFVGSASNGFGYYCPSIGGVAFNCWIDGAVQAYDALSQTIATNIGDSYLISFYVAEDSAIVAPPNASGLPPNYPGSACWAAAQPGYSGPPCTFSDVSTNGDTTDPGGNGINVTVYAGSALPTPSTQSGAASPGTELALNYQGGFGNGITGNGYDANVLLAPETPAETVQVTAIQQTQAACTALVDASFRGAECFAYNNSGGTDPYGAVMFEYTCPGSATAGTCGSVNATDGIDFFAMLGTDLYFDQADNPTLFYGSAPNYYVIPLPLVGWLKGSGPDPLNPCTPYTNNTPALFQSNQISSFTDPAKSPASGTAKGSSGGTGSCWVLTYLTPGETPTVTVTQPVNGFTYQQNQTNAATQANYTCTTVNNSNVSVGGQPIGAVGPYLTLALTNGCTATDSVGGSVAQGAQFDTATLGPHTFTATVVDSALNTVSSTPVTYNVVAATNVAIQNSASNQTTPGSKLTYVITAWDSGPANAVNTLVTDTLAPGTTFVSASGVNIGLPCTTVGGKTSCKLSYTPITCMGSALSSVVTCPVGTIMPISLFDLNGAVIEVTVLVNQQGTKQNPTKLSNTATVTQSNAETKQDNSSTAVTTVN